MAAVRNISPKGDLDVPALGRTVKSGEVVTIPDDLQLPPTDFEAVKETSNDHTA